MTTLVPLGSLVSGVSPEAIKDPVLRKQYEDSIAENTKKLTDYGTQYHLRQLRSSYESSVIQHVVNMWSLAPSDENSLKKMLSDEGVGDVLTEKVLRLTRSTQP